MPHRYVDAILKYPPIGPTSRSSRDSSPGRWASPRRSTARSARRSRSCATPAGSSWDAKTPSCCRRSHPASPVSTTRPRGFGFLVPEPRRTAHRRPVYPRGLLRRGDGLRPGAGPRSAQLVPRARDWSANRGRSSAAPATGSSARWSGPRVRNFVLPDFAHGHADRRVSRTFPPPAARSAPRSSSRSSSTPPTRRVPVGVIVETLVRKVNWRSRRSRVIRRRCITGPILRGGPRRRAGGDCRV